MRASGDLRNALIYGATATCFAPTCLPKRHRRVRRALSRRVADLRDPERTHAFPAIFRPVFDLYQDRLSRAGEIDFHDMINRATDLVEVGLYRNPYGYLIAGHLTLRGSTSI